VWRDVTNAIQCSFFSSLSFSLPSFNFSHNPIQKRSKKKTSETQREREREKRKIENNKTSKEKEKEKNE